MSTTERTDPRDWNDGPDDRPLVVAESVSKVYSGGGSDVSAVEDFTLTIRRGEFCSVVGPSGCGKSTILRMLAGLENPSTGTISISHADAARPSTAVAFQDYSIFPWKTVAANVAFGLRMHGIGSREAAERATEWIRRMDLAEFAERYPTELSGGMKQRVALARALALDPDLLLLDEPFAALDAQLRQIFQEDLLALWESGPTRTAFFVTHSLEEAILLGDRVVLVTARPARIKREFAVPFPRPRTPEIREHPDFIELRSHIWAELQTEVTRVAPAA